MHSYKPAGLQGQSPLFQFVYKWMIQMEVWEGLQVLMGVNLEADPGQSIALVGASGSGKYEDPTFNPLI